MFEIMIFQSILYEPGRTTLSTRFNRKEGAQIRPLFCLPFFFFGAPSFFFFSLEGDFFESPLFALLFFFQQFWLQNRVFELFFPYFYSRPLFFFLLKEPSFFFFLMEGSFFCALFSPSFFFPPSFLLNLSYRLLATMKNNFEDLLKEIITR